MDFPIAHAVSVNFHAIMAIACILMISDKHTAIRQIVIVYGFDLI
jgi:hypothetical protein